MTDALIDQLRAADRRDFKRSAVPAVYAEYERFADTGMFYNDDFVAAIARAHGVGAKSWGENQRFDHQAVHDLGEPLLIALHHEVYLAGGQRRLRLMREAEAALMANGFRPITELVPHEGMRIEMPGGYTYRVEPTGRGGWYLLPPRKRTNGLSLDAMVQEHRAYEKGYRQGWAELNGPAVRMYREVTS